MTVWFTSDLHFGHHKVAAIRGFDSTEAHDAELMRRWRDLVRPGDDVWVLGDIAVSSPTSALFIIAQLPGRKHLIAGNHDKVHPMYRDAHKHMGEYGFAFQSVASAGRRRIEGTEVLLSHFPYHRDRGEVRHVQWRLRNEGKWLIHGHMHTKERVTVDYRPFPTTHEVHVGVDAWDLAPVNLDTIAALMRQYPQGEV
jgi:calcineurin-like phosphoesterase family protein